MKFDRETLDKLKASNIPHAQAVDFLKVEQAGPEADALLAEADKYFSAFIKGQPGGACVCCGKKQGGNSPIDAILGNAYFRWGLAHGEGFCSNCVYPARAHHEIPQIGRITNIILQYHPDGLSFESLKAKEVA